MSEATYPPETYLPDGDFPVAENAEGFGAIDAIDKRPITFQDALDWAKHFTDADLRHIADYLIRGSQYAAPGVGYLPSQDLSPLNRDQPVGLMIGLARGTDIGYEAFRATALDAVEGM